MGADQLKFELIKSEQLITKYKTCWWKATNQAKFNAKLNSQRVSSIRLKGKSHTFQRHALALAVVIPPHRLNTTKSLKRAVTRKCHVKSDRNDFKKKKKFTSVEEKRSNGALLIC